MSPRISLPFKRNISVPEPYAIDIEVDEKHRRLGGFELVGTEVVVGRCRILLALMTDDIEPFIL